MKKSRSSKSKPAATPAATRELPLTVLAEPTSLTALRNQTGFFSRAWAWLQSRQSTGPDNRRLRVADTVSLGEKRFVAVVQVAGRDFLVAGGPSNIALLAQLNPDEPFEDVLRRTMTIPGQPAAKAKAKRKRPKRKQKAKPAANAANASPVGDASPANEPQMARSHKSGSFGQVLQKSIKPARKPPVKAKPAAPPAGQESNADPEAEAAPVMPPFNVPESFRYVLQNTTASDGNGAGKPAQQNGRSETEHTGHWA